MSMALSPVAWLMTRDLYALLNTRQSWCEMRPVTDDARSEDHFWLTEISKFNGQNIWVRPSALRVVYTDASQTGYAGYTVQHGCHIVQDQWLLGKLTKAPHGEKLEQSGRSLNRCSQNCPMREPDGLQIIRMWYEFSK